MNKSDLKDLSNLFNEVKDVSEDSFNSFVRLPDGNYKAIVEDIEVTESKSGKPMCVLSYKVTAGENKGFVHKQFIMLCGNDEEQARRNINRFATTVKKLGADTSDYETTVKTLGNGIDTKVTLMIETTIAKNGNEYTNTSFEVE